MVPTRFESGCTWSGTIPLRGARNLQQVSTEMSNNDLVCEMGESESADSEKHLDDRARDSEPRSNCNDDHSHKSLQDATGINTPQHGDSNGRFREGSYFSRKGLEFRKYRNGSSA